MSNDELTGEQVAGWDEVVIVDNHVRLATRSSRVFAAIFDGVIALMVVVVSAVAAYNLVDPSQLVLSEGSMGQFMRASIVALAVLLAPSGLLWILQARMLSMEGQTLGKHMVGIRVERVDGRPAGFVHAVLLRGVVPVAAAWFSSLVGLPSLGSLITTSGLLLIFREDQRCLHDWIADTRVVDA